MTYKLAAKDEFEVSRIAREQWDAVRVDSIVLLEPAGVWV